VNDAPVNLAPACEGFFAVPGARLHYRVIGSSTPLVVLHGGPDFDHHYLLPELDRLAGVARLIYYDQRGRGRSADLVAPEDVTLESEVEDLDRLRRISGSRRWRSSATPGARSWPWSTRRGIRIARAGSCS